MNLLEKIKNRYEWDVYIPVRHFIIHKIFRKKYWLSFISYSIFDSKYYNYIAGRCEIYDNNDIDGSGFAMNEISYFTLNTPEIHKFIDAWDFKNITQKELDFVINEIKTKYQREI